MLKRSGCGRLFATGGCVGRLSSGGGVTLTVGEGIDMARLPLRTELFFPLRLQETAESDLEGAVADPFVLLEVILFDMGLPRTVPPLMTVVRLGVEGGLEYSTTSSSPIFRLPNFPLSAAVMGWSVLKRPSFDRS